MSDLHRVAGSRARLLRRLGPAIALAALAVLALTGAIDPLQGGALTMLPAVALAVAMLSRPYLGERMIARLRRRGPRRLQALAPVAPRLRAWLAVDA
jgi:hypothetical protein